VCRWFIEREGGSQVVSKLVLMGPPNEGTPLAVLQEWATSLITLGLNGLLAVANPAAALVGLAGFVTAALAGFERIDTTLDQLRLNSEFYKDLNRSPDPGVPYHVVIGSTREITPAARPIAPAATPGQAFAQAAARVFSPRVVHRLLSVAFANQPNDMAISVKSAEAVTRLKPERKPAPNVTVVECDHISYFSTPVGLKALGAALAA
jgi:hypothetical protein